MDEKQKDVTATGRKGGQRQDVMSKEIFGNQELFIALIEHKSSPD